MCITHLHSKNVRVKNSRSFENVPVWVKTTSFNPVMGHIWVNFRTKCLTRNSGLKKKQDGGAWKKRETD